MHKVLKIISLIHFHLNYGLGLHVSLIGNHPHFSVREINFSPAGVEVIKMMLNSAHDWLDPSTMKLFMNIKGDSAADLTPRVAGAWGMFSRLRVLCSGDIIEDIDLYGRFHEQFHMMKPSEKRFD